MKKLVIGMIVLGLAAAASASVLVSDDFSYADGYVTNVSGGVWNNYSGAGGASSMFIASGAMQVAASRAEDVNTTLGGARTSGNIYGSFSLNLSAIPNAAGSYPFMLGTGTSSFRDRIFLNNGSGTNYSIGIGNASTVGTNWNASLNLGTTYTIVFRSDLDNDTSYLWVDPADETDPSVSVTVASTVTADWFGARQASGEGTMTIDNLLIATTFAEVVGGAPAPGTNVKFTASAASVDEDAGTYIVTVVKTLAEGNVSGQVALSGTATLGGAADYTINTTNFTMNGVTTSATFTVTINDDAVEEGDETVILTLANVVGGAAAAPTAFTLTINASDVPLLPIITLNPVGASKSVNVDNPISFDVTASQPAGDAGQSTILKGIIPAGATFLNKTGAAPVTATFAWTPDTVGIYTSVFTAADTEGIVTQAVVITVSEPGTGGLIISQYYEGASNNKWIEIFNAGSVAVDLTAGGYRLGRWDNAARESWKTSTAPGSSIVLSNSISAGSTYLVKNSAAVLPGYAVADLSSGSLTFNGDDSVVLYTGATYDYANVVDAFGMTGTNGADTSFVRKATIINGVNTDFNAADWDQFAITNVDNAAESTNERLGYHNTGGEPPATTTNVKFSASAAAVAEGVGTYIVTVVKTLAEGNVSGQIALTGTATEGGAADYTINTTNYTMNGATTSATFTVTINDDAEVEGPETIVLTLTQVVGATLMAPTAFTLTINANDTPPEGILAFRFTDAPYLQVTTKDSNLTVSDMTLSAGTIETAMETGDYFPNEPYIEESTGWTADSQATAKNFNFNFTPVAGYQVAVTAITFRAYATSAGPSAFGFDIGDGAATYAVDAPSAALVEVSQPVAGVNGETASINVLIQGWTNATRATSGVGSFRIDDVVIWGSVTATGGATVDPTITAATLVSGQMVLVFSNEVSATYTLQRSADLLAVPAFSNLVTGITGGSYTQNVVNDGPVSAYRMMKQ